VKRYNPQSLTQNIYKVVTQPEAESIDDEDIDTLFNSIKQRFGEIDELKNQLKDYQLRVADLEYKNQILLKRNRELISHAVDLKSELYARR
jgi:hypothetical protein